MNNLINWIEKNISNYEIYNKTGGGKIVMSIKKEMYNFTLENRSDSDRPQYINLGKKEINVYFNEYGETTECVAVTNNEVIESLKKEYGIKNRVCSNCIEIANGDHISWQPTNYVKC